MLAEKSRTASNIDYRFTTNQAQAVKSGFPLRHYVGTRVDSLDIALGVMADGTKDILGLWIETAPPRQRYSRARGGSSSGSPTLTAGHHCWTRLRAPLLDLRFQITGSRRAPDDVVVVAIDDADAVTTLPFWFPAVRGKKLTAGFDGVRLSSDGGVMLLAQAARRMRIAEKLAAAIPDPRDPTPSALKLHVLWWQSSNFQTTAQSLRGLHMSIALLEEEAGGCEVRPPGQSLFDKCLRRFRPV